ncbi:HNH endonuclease signature motif containing protein [Salana multivorans]|uniref:HNH endonuclease signature motif containing protein n=1 Tax=Salana multivorans TaxID=120377 RepID=UPI000F4BDDCB
MVTSRTGTTSHLRFRKAVLAAGRAAGVTRCPVPGCGVWLDYDVSRQPNSAEPDHIIRVVDGGTNDASNGRVICRRCNQRLGQRRAETRAAPPLGPGAEPRIEW